MNKVLLTLTVLLFFATFIRAANPHGDLRIEMLEYHNLVVDHNIQTPAGASPRAVYIGVKFCNDGANPLTEVFANIGDFIAGTPGVYPVTTVPSGLYSGSFSFTHEGGTKDAVRYIGTLAPGECVTQYWLLSYPLLDANGNRVVGSKPDQTDDLRLKYDVWASANDGGTHLEANTSKTLQLRAEISAMANKIWPNTTSKVPNEFLAAFPDKQLGWRQTTPSSASHPGATVVLEGIWFDLGNIRKGFDNNGDYIPDYNFLLQPVGNPSIYDANCFRLVKVSGLIVIKLQGGAIQTIEFTDQMHFKGIPEDNTGAVGMVFYEFAVLNGPCSSTLTPYQEVASGSNNEKHNGDFGAPGGTLTSTPPTTTVTVNVPTTTTPGTQTTIITTIDHNGSQPIGDPGKGTPVVITGTVPTGTTYVPGSASSSNTLPPGVDITILYSSDNGESWVKSEPPANTVTDIIWLLEDPLPPGSSVELNINVDVPANFTRAEYCGYTQVGLGFSEPFAQQTTCSFVPGDNSLTGKVWQDNGGTTGTAGNGFSEGDEQPLVSIPVTLIYDANDNGKPDDTERNWGTQYTNPSGGYAFSNLPDGNFVVVADKSVVVSNPSYEGWGPTTILTQPVDVDSENTNPSGVTISTGHDFGFAPAIEVAKTQVNTNPVPESSTVCFDIDVTNQLLSTDASEEPCTFWTTAVQSGVDWSPSPAYAVGANGPDGNYARYAKNGNGINQPLYTNAIHGTCPGQITKVEIINYIYTKNNLANDSFSVSAVIPSVGTYSKKYFGGDLDDYYGIENAHELVTDITNQKASWTWTDIQNMSLVITGEQNGFHIWVDAMGVRVTTEATVNPNAFSYGFDESTTVTKVPLVDDYDQTRFEYITSSIAPDTVDVINGRLVWNNLGPLDAGETAEISVCYKIKDVAGNTAVSSSFITRVVDAEYSTGQRTNNDESTISTTISPRGTISGKVFSDKNTNGWMGILGYEANTDGFMENVVVTLYGCVKNGTTFYPSPSPTRVCTHVQNGGTWAVLQRDTTTLTGDYDFKGLANGYYYIQLDIASIPGTETQRADPDKTSGLCTTCDHMWKSSGLAMSALGTIGIANDLINVNFGYSVNPAISGIVFEDVNANGLQDGLDKPLTNVTVERVSTGCTQGVNCPTAVTNAMGKYEFTSLTAGTAYTIKVRTATLPATFVWTQTFESDGTINNAIARTLATGTQSFDNDFGWKRGGNSDLGGYVYQDITGEGSGVNNNAIFPQVTLQLYEDKNNNGVLDNGTDILKATTESNSSGYFQFPGNSAADYIVVLTEEDLPKGTTETVDPDEPGICITCDNMAVVTDLNGTTDITNLNFGYEIKGDATIEGNVFLDQNGNSIFNNFETGIAYVEVKLEADLTGSGTFTQTETVFTSSDGHYYFDELPAGEYRVVVNTNDASLPVDSSGQIALPTTDGSFTFTTNGTEITKINNVACSGTCSDETPEFGFALPGKIESNVFYDADGNGTQDWNEPGIPGVTVYLCDANAGVCDGTTATITTVTNSEGEYSFVGLPVGYYTVSVNTATLPDGVTANSLTGDPGTDGVPCYFPLDPADPNFTLLSGECNNRLDEISITNGSLVASANFGYQPTSVVGDIVFRDLDLDGTQSNTEPGIPELQVRLENVTTVTRNGTTYPPGTYTETVQTDFDGGYSFINVPDGTWEVEVIPPANMTSSYDPDGGTDNRVELTIGGGDITSVGNVWCQVGEECSLDIAFGLRPTYPNTITGTVCLDADSDGQCDPSTDVPPNNIIIFVYSDDGTELGQTYADVDGNFEFNYLPNDTVIISVSMTQTPLQLTSITTSTGDTPAFEVRESAESATQRIRLTGNVSGVDFAFAFTDTFDLGDLPLPYLTSVNGVSTGPAHILEPVPTLYLGATVDPEFHAITDAEATGDDLNGVDDEDGVVFTNPSSWTEGTASSGNGGGMTVTVVGSGYLVAWVDFSQDGDFNDRGELVVSQYVMTGTYPIEFDIPDGTDLSGGQELYTRVRLMPDEPFSPETTHDGIVYRGEVEDYLLTVCHNLTDAGTITGNETGCNGFDPSAITETLAPSGGGGTLEYQWQQSTDDGLTWTDIPGATDAAFDPVAITETTRYRRGALREHCAGMVYSNPVIKTVLTNFDDAGIIVGDEDYCGIYDPGTMLNILAPSGGSGTGTVYYQWQQSTDGGTTWMDIAAANDEYYDPGIISQTTQYRRAARKAPCGDYVFSNVIVKMVAVNFISAGTITGNESFCGSFDPGIITNTSLPSGGTDGYIGYQWERSIDGGNTWVVIPGATGIDYNPGNITQSTQYRRKARRVPCGVWVNSNVVTKAVRTIPTASIATFPISGTGTLCELTDYVFSAASAGAGVTYNWDFGPYANMASSVEQGPMNVQFNVPNGTSVTSTTVTLTVDKDGCTVTDSKVLNFRPEIVISNVILTDPDACSAMNGSITILASHPPLSTILYSVDGGATWTNSNNISSLGAGVYDIKVRYVNGECEERYGYVSLSDPPPAADLYVSSMEECTGQTFTVNAVATAGAPTYTWFFGSNASPSTAAGPGPHNVTFSSGGPATIAVRLEEAGCVGVTDTTLTVVENYSDGGSILGGGTLCSEYNPAAIAAGSNPAGGYGGSAFFQWEQREKTDSTGWGAWSEIVGANSASFDPGIISNTTEYRRKARRSPCTDWVYSNSVTTVLMLKPLLGDDNYFTVCPGFPFADNVNINDYSLKNPTFSLLIWPTNGTLDFENDGEILYVPNSTYCGTDEFKYFVCNDGTVCCDTANVIVDLTDIVPPTIANVPANITISCDDQMPLTETVQVIENCQNVSIGIDQFITQGSDSCALYNYDFVRVWNGVDYCTNTNQATQTISVEDKTSPDIYRIYTLPNGKRLVAGVMENVTENWKTVSLPVNFATQPVIFAQITTRNDAAPAVVRLRNVSTTQFQVRVQEEEAADGIRLRENIAWIAMEKGTYGGSIPFEVNTWLLTHVGAVQAFAQSYSVGPEFLASVQTNNEGDPVNLRYDNLSSGNVKVHLQEETSLDAEVDHNYETIGYMAIQGNTSFKTNTGEVFGEVGRVNVTESIVTVNLQHTYHNPVVIVGSPSYNDQSPVTTRVFGVTSNSFQVKLDEYDYLDGTHSVENLSYFVVEGSLPLDHVVSCDNIPAPLAIGTEIIAKDNCDATVLLRMSENDLEFDCATDTVLIRTWYVVDDCGNETQLSHRMMLRDTEAPTFTVPDNVTIVCGDNTADLNITGNVNDAADNCAIEVHPYYVDDQSNLLGCNGYIVRTWIAEDDCGNMTTKVQTITVTPPIDTDLDGIANYFDLDDDNDGIPDTIEGDTDFDGDGVPNSQDLDSDNDGITDLVETGRIDTNGDGVIDIIGTPGWDNDNDGFAYGYDGNDINAGSGASSTFNPGSLTNDRDQDGVPNYLDRDSDNDGITDLIEAGGADTDGDGILDYPTIGDPLTMPDEDNDGFHDRVDADDDGLAGAEDTTNPLVKYDGSNYTGGLTSDKPDFDGDSVPNFLDTDSDNDGIPDLIEAGGVDFDGDGRLKLTGYFIDTNTDGYFDIYAYNPLVRTDAATATGGMRPKDSDFNGTVFITGDADLDGRPNHMDHDSDNDKIVDIYETGMYARDVNGDGIIDNFTDMTFSGFDDVAEASGNIITEQDGATIDGRPEDSGDADESAYVSTQSDGTFASANGTPDVDDDGDGLLNFLDVDSDNDLILDIIEDKNYNGKINVGETHLYNPDTDGDAIKDGDEDRNRNGKRDPDETSALDSNSDGDLLSDGDEDTNKDGVVDAGESRPLDPCDPYLSVACKGVAVNVKVKLLGSLVGVADTTSVMRDDLRQKLVLPTTEPYTKLTHIDHIGVPVDPNSDTETPGGNTGIGDYNESFKEGLLYITGLDAPVDWVLVELRSASKPDSVIATRAGVLQADGDIRDIDGYDYLRFAEVPNGNYFVSVRHRNHLGTMTSVPYLLSPYPTDIDFTNPSLAVYGTDARAVRNGEMTLWPGDFNNDGKVLYQGPVNDIIHLLLGVVQNSDNDQGLANFVVQGYRQADLNLDGFSIYQGPNNDRSMLLLNAILKSPENVLLLANFIVLEKLP